MATEQETREFFASNAQSLAGLGYGHDRPHFLEAIAPLEVEGNVLQDEMGHMWCCALTVMGFWRLCLVRHILLVTRYTNTQAMIWVGNIGDSFQATRFPDGHSTPKLGDTVMVNSGSHVIAAVVAINSDGTVDIVEGGHKDSGGMCIVKGISKPLRYVGNVLKIGDATVFKWFDCTTFGVDVPKPEMVNVVKPADTDIFLEGAKKDDSDS